jgi:hypothetical protein
MNDEMTTVRRRLESGEYKSRLEEAVALRTEEPGRLNPAWVEWLMGFPIGWTDLGPSETPSSPQSQSTSDG